MPFHPYQRQVPTGQRRNHRHSPRAAQAQSRAAGSSFGLEPVDSVDRVSFGAPAGQASQAPAAAAHQRDARYSLQQLHYQPGERLLQADREPSFARNPPSILQPGNERDSEVTAPTEMSWQITQYMYRAYEDDLAAEGGTSSMTGLQYGALHAGALPGPTWGLPQQQGVGPSTSWATPAPAKLSGTHDSDEIDDETLLRLLSPATENMAPQEALATAPQHEQPPHPLFDHEETQATKTETVDREQKYLLDLANSIIGEVKNALPFGSANHIDRQPDAIQRVTFAYDGEPAREIARLMGSKPRREALIAATVQAGNCDQMASIAYTRARIKLGPEYLAEIAQIPGHTFCRVGKTGWPFDKCVIIDPWPKHAYAVIGKDHFSHGQPMTTCRAKPGKGSAPAAEKSDRYAALVRHAKESWRSYRAGTMPNPGTGLDYTRFNVLYPTPRHSPFSNIDYRIGPQPE